MGGSGATRTHTRTRDRFLIKMPCKECGCCIPDNIEDVAKIEEYQAIIDELCGRMSYSRSAVRGLKMDRNFLMKRVWFELGEMGYWIRRRVLRDRAIPIDWRTGEWYVGDGEECTDGE